MKKQPIKEGMQYWVDGVSCVSDEWEAAYEKYESPSQEIIKFIKRLKKVGAEDWNMNSRIIDLFCGRGNGLVALEKMGFSQLYGVDLSDDLLSQYKGKAKLFVGDCRDIQLDDGEIDYAIVQGGLHHLEDITRDLEKTVSEVNRILKKDGTFVLVEPWNTLFLKFMHRIYRLKWLRSRWEKLDALATMTELEYPIYNRWIESPDEILSILHSYFEPQKTKFHLGKIIFQGRKIQLGKTV